VNAVGGYLAEVGDALAALDHDAVLRVLAALERAYLDDRTIFVLGNGGSAATASHLAADLGKNTRHPGVRPVRAISLTDHLAALSAWANDEGYESVFAGQLAGLVNPGDVVVGISTSGRSPNVLEAFRYANKAGAVTVGLLGRPGGPARDLAAVSVLVSGAIDQQEDQHGIISHIMTRHLRGLVHAVAMTLEEP
jgi:D-sedoheptulose 7-phosphate isomerase